MQISFPNKNILLKFTFVNKVNVVQHSVDSIYISKMQNNIFQMIITLIPFCLRQIGAHRNQVFFSNTCILPLFHVLTLQAVPISPSVCFFRISETRFNEFTYAKSCSFPFHQIPSKATDVSLNRKRKYKLIQTLVFRFLIFGGQLMQKFSLATHLHPCSSQDLTRQGTADLIWWWLEPWSGGGMEQLREKSLSVSISISYLNFKICNVLFVIKLVMETLNFYTSYCEVQIGIFTAAQLK